jgi:hypothetical protein
VRPEILENPAIYLVSEEISEFTILGANLRVFSKKTAANAIFLQFYVEKVGNVADFYLFCTKFGIICHRKKVK